MRQLPQAKAGIATGADAVEVEILQKDLVRFARVKFFLEFGTGALLINQWHHHIGGVDDVPVRRVIVGAGGEVAHRRRRAGAVFVCIPDVVGIEKVLPVVAKGGLALAE